MTIADGRVPPSRPPASVADILVGKPVRALTWLDFASLAHWISGRGQVIVPQHRTCVILDGVSTQARYYVPASGRAIERWWVVELRSVTHGAGATARGTLTAGGYSQTVSASSDLWPSIYLLREKALTPSTSESEISILISSTGGAALRVESIGCWELPRAVLDRTAADCGIALDSLFPRRPIFNDGSSPLEYSLGNVVGSAHEMTVANPLRRIGHVGRWGYELTSSSASAASLTVGPYHIVPRKDRTTDTTRTIRCRVYGYESTGVGQYRVVGGTAGASSWVTLPTSAGWSTEIDIAIDCEDLSTADGQPAGGYDTLDFQARSNGVQAWTIQGWVAYEYT